MKAGMSAWSLEFFSAEDLQALFRLVGVSAAVVQFEPGPLKGVFGVSICETATVIKISTSSGLVVVSDRNKEFLCFSGDRLGRAGFATVHGQSLRRGVLAGMKLDLSESFFQLHSGCEARILVAPRSLLLEKLVDMNAHHLLDGMMTCNQMHLNVDLYALLMRYLEGFDDPAFELVAVDPVDLLVDIIMSPQGIGFSAARFLSRHQLVKSMIKFSSNHPTAQIDLDQLAEVLFCSRRSLIQGSKELMGIGPGELLRLVRLERVHQVLRNRAKQAQLGKHAVAPIAAHFGFSSRCHFAAAYQRQYGNSPSETLRASKA